MVKLLLQFVKAERTGNWELHLLCVSTMGPHFFPMDRPNYARWLPVYISDMRSIVTKHPEFHQEFVKGSHAVSRSGRPFTQVWTDMALEQSINADSKSKGGIIGISRNPGALDRWFLTSHERASVTTSLKGMFLQESTHLDGHKEAAAKRIARDEADVQKLISCFTSDLMRNSFKQDTQPLVNFGTGVVLPNDIAEGLVRSTEKGRDQMNTFVENRLNTTEISFWDPIPKLNVKTFKFTTKKVQVKAANDKLVTVGADRDLFGHLLITANVRQINLRDVLCYELSPIPFSLAHQDGSVRKTTKSALATLVETKVNVCARLEPFARDTIHLGMAFIQVMKSAGSSTFGDLTTKYFNVLTSSFGYCKELHIVFDQYWDALIKNKINLCEFLSETFCELGRQEHPPEKTLVISGGLKNARRAVKVRYGHCEDVDYLESDHEEADTSIAHISDINCAESWFKTGVNDRTRYVPVHAISQELGENMSCALLTFHSITGCDSTSALAGIGKKKGWQLLSKSEQHQESLSLPGSQPNLSDEVAAKCEDFICDLYPAHRKMPHTVDELRYILFCKKKQKNQMLPPTSHSLLQHLKRVNYQTFIWRMALTAIQNLPDPENHGWVRDGPSLKPVYMTKEPALSSLLELTACTCKSGCQRNCSCT
eukprot:gene4496-5094_t